MVLKKRQEIKFRLKASLMTKPAEFFVGREKLKIKLVQSIQNSLVNGACILVGGYRGVGKTRLVIKVIETVKKRRGLLFLIKERRNLLKEYRNSKVNDIYVDLGVDSDLTIRDILCDLTESIYYRERNKYRVCLFAVLLFSFIVASAIFQIQMPLNDVFGLHQSLNIPLEYLKQYLLGKSLASAVGPLIIVVFFLLLFIYSFYLIHAKIFKDYRYIKNLVAATRYKRAIESNAFMGNLAKSKFRFGRKSTLSEEPISSRRIQQSLKHYFEISKNKYVIVFDEIDKINPEKEFSNDSKTKGRKEKVDELLGGLKSFFSGSKAVFIMVAGREMVDAYYSESGYTSVLYEGVFDEVFYVPTLLTDTTDDMLSDHESMVRRYVDELRIKDHENDVKSLDKMVCYSLLIKYLTLHSWGNIKRISMLIKDFIEWDQNPSPTSPTIIIREKEFQRLLASAKLYSLFDINLGRLIESEDDKLIVSSMITILDAVRFHSQGFSRAMLDRTVAGIDIHSEINLTNIADEFINSTFQSIIRRTGNNIYPYRFHLTTDIEFSYLTKTIGGKSSAFEFALDSADPVRRHYQNEIIVQNQNNAYGSPLSVSKTNTILGDIYVSEQSYDKAYQSYSEAINSLKTVLRSADGDSWRHAGGVSLESHYQLVQTMLKKGLLEEIRENSKSAQRIYEEAQNIAQISFEWPIRVKGASQATENSYLDISEPNNLWLSKTIKTRTSNRTRHTSLIVHAILSQDFLNLKSGKRPTNYFFKDDIDIDIEKMEASIITKIILLNLFSSNFRVFTKSYKDFLKVYKNIIISGKQLKGLPFCYSKDNSLLVFAYGQALYCMSAFELKKEIRLHYNVFKHGVKDLKSKYLKKNLVKEEFLTEFNLKRQIFFLETCKIWAGLLRKTTALKGSLSSLEGDIEMGPYAKIGPLLSTSDKKHSEEETGSHRLFIKSLYFLYSAANLAKRKGKYSQAAHQFTGIFLNWIALLEIFPWQVFGQIIPKLPADWKSRKNSDDIEIIVLNLLDTPGWVRDLVSEAQLCVEKSDRGAFMDVRRDITDQWIKASSDHGGATSLSNTSYEAMRVTDILAFINDSNRVDESERGKTDNSYAILKSPLVWYRSNISNYLLVFCLWEQYCRYSILMWFKYYLEEELAGIDNQVEDPRQRILNRLRSKKYDLNIVSSPPANLPRASSLFKWLESRIASHKLLESMKLLEGVDRDLRESLKAKSDQRSDDRVLELTKKRKRQTDLIRDGVSDVISQNLFAIDLCRRAFRSDDPDSFPPKSHIYFHLYEILANLEDRLTPENYENSIREIVAKLKSTLRSRRSIALDAIHLKAQLEKNVSDLEEISNISSLSFRKKLRHKYYLYDDYEDTFFVTEWSFLQMLSSGSKLLKVYMIDASEILRDMDE